MILTIFFPSFLRLFYCSETSTLTVGPTLWGSSKTDVAYEGSWSKTSFPRRLHLGYIMLERPDYRAIRPLKHNLSLLNDVPIHICTLPPALHLQ